MMRIALSIIPLLTVSLLALQGRGETFRNETFQITMTQDFFDNVQTHLTMPLVKALPNLTIGNLSLDFDIGFLKLGSNLTNIAFNSTSYD
jgi:hypothetical protein